jgi:hypothetical protein
VGDSPSKIDRGFLLCLSIEIHKVAVFPTLCHGAAAPGAHVTQPESTVLIQTRCLSEGIKMRVAVIGANGTLGSAVVAALSPRYEVVRVTHSKGEYRVDLADPFSIREMYHKVGHVDAVISAAGVTRFAPFASLTDADFALSLSNKLMGQVNLVRFGLEHVRDGGSFTLTSGILSRQPMV